MAVKPEALPSARTSYPQKGFSTLGALFRWYWAFTRSKPPGGIAIVLIAILAIVAIFGPWIAPQDPLQLHPRSAFLKPQWTHGFILGTDHLGRDNLSRLIIGARASLSIAAASVLCGSLIGWFVGLVSGYSVGKVDMIIQRLIDVKMAIPGLVLLMAIVAVLGRDRSNLILALSIGIIPGNARLCRSAVLSIRTMDYVHAARAMGASNVRIMLRHILPQTFAPWLVVVSASVGGIILAESSLSFLGLGTVAPKPSWGAMLAGPALTNIERAPWNAVWPGLFLSITVFSFNLLGDALRDVLDPRLRR